MSWCVNGSQERSLSALYRSTEVSLIVSPMKDLVWLTLEGERQPSG